MTKQKAASKEIEYPESNKSKKATPQKKRIVNLDNYDSWRVVDSYNVDFSLQEQSRTKGIYSPKLIVKAFGVPEPSPDNNISYGYFEFEDSNLDRFIVFHFNPSNVKTRKMKINLMLKELNSIHDSSLNYPNINENLDLHGEDEDKFWNIEEPKEFRLIYTRYADKRKFKRWFWNELEKAKESKTSFDNIIDQKYGPMEQYNKFDRNYPIENSHGILKYDFIYFMTEEQKKKLKSHELPEKIVKNHYLDPKNSQRVTTTLEEFKEQIEKEKLEAKKKI